MSEGRQMLGRIRRTAVRLHRQLVILRALMQRLELDLAEKLTLRLATARLRQRLEWLDTEIVSLRDRAHLLQEEVTMKTAEQTNRNLHVLAIVTTLFMPASLIAGIFGHECRRPAVRAERQRIPVVDGASSPDRRSSCCGC